MSDNTNVDRFNKDVQLESQITNGLGTAGRLLESAEQATGGICHGLLADTTKSMQRIYPVMSTRDGKTFIFDPTSPQRRDVQFNDWDPKTRRDTLKMTAVNWGDEDRREYFVSHVVPIEGDIHPKRRAGEEQGEYFSWRGGKRMCILVEPKAGSEIGPEVGQWALFFNRMTHGGIARPIKDAIREDILTSSPQGVIAGQDKLTILDALGTGLRNAGLQERAPIKVNPSNPASSTI